MKIYIYLLYAFIIINTVIAPLYGEYFAHKLWKEIKKVFRLMLIIFPIMGGYIWITTLYFMSDIIALWTGAEDFFIGSIFILFMGSFFYFIGYVNSYITLLYSIGEIKSILFIRWKEVTLNIGLSFILTYYLGVVGIAIGMSIATILTSVIQIPKFIKQQTNGKIKIDFKIQKKHFILILFPSLIVAFLSSVLIHMFFLKFLIFIIMSGVYMIFSWKIMALRDKIYLLKLVHHRKLSE
jgi:O-antigen/teichoic acid export membrane protein